MLVLAQHDTVVALFSCTEDMQSVLDHAWTHLLPALRPAPLAPGAGDDGLADRLAGARLPTAADRLAGARLPTAADRVGGAVGGATGAIPGPGPAPDGRYAPAPPHGRTHRRLTVVEVVTDHLVLREGERAPIRIPLSADWTDVPDPPISASATVDASGRLVVDLALLATPHHLELTLDPATRTFDAAWPADPLFGGGLASTLTRMRPPAP